VLNIYQFTYNTKFVGANDPPELWSVDGKREPKKSAKCRICRDIHSREHEDDDERQIKSFFGSLDGELRVKEDAYLPLAMDGEQVTISGIVDLVHIRPDTVEIIDFKTDLGRHAEGEYRKQLSVYYHVLDEWFPERDVTAGMFYTAEGDRVDIDPLSLSKLAELIVGLH
jgi:ATP-dependent exoDNAse (exonuclease V) beta subunit